MIKRNVVLRSIVTENLRHDLSQQLQAAAEEMDRRMSEMDAQTRAYITDLQRNNLQQAMAVRKQIEAEKKRQQDMRDAMLERKAAVEELEDGTEVTRGTLESFVEVKVGDNLRAILGGVQIVTKDDQVIEIREGDPALSLDEAVGQLMQEESQE
jgi:hypothetical protein